MAFGDVLRGMASVLSPQVAQEVAQEDQQQRQMQSQAALLRFKDQLEQQSPEGQAKVQALKNELGYRDAMTKLPPDADYDTRAKVAAQFGKPELQMAYLKAKEDRAARVQQAADTLELKRAQLDQTHELTLQRLTDSQAKQAETERHNRAQEALNTQLGTMKLELAGLKATGDKEKDQAKRTQQLASSLERAGLPESDAVLGAVEDALKKVPDMASYISGPKSLLPDFAVGTDIAAGRQAFQKLFNITLKNRSGSAVTNQELERLKQEFATGAFKTSAQLQKAVEQARNIVNRHYMSVASGFGNDALDSYNENLRGFGGRVVLQGAKPSGVVDFGDLK
jgi:hypothetical protein